LHPHSRSGKSIKTAWRIGIGRQRKMRPVETILLDLYKATKKYGQVDQVGFFKDIAGEEAFVGLQTLVAGAGSGELQKLVRN
jgi:phage-related tail protein